MIKGKNILITGGTGSLGQALVNKILKMNPNVIRVFSRDENKQLFMKENFNDSRLRFLLGDIRDRERLDKAMEDIDIVIHTAALKHIDVGEYNPFEFIKTNIYGSQNVVDSAMNANVSVCLGISTDKAVSPLNLYGATKLAMEKLFISANQYKGKRKTKFFCVRYGNVFGSRGSVIPKFLEQIKTKGIITVTNPDMTRFNIIMDDALNFIMKSIQISKGEEVFIPKLEAYKLSSLINSLKEVSSRSFKIKNIPTRQAEKMHELLLNQDEIPSTIEYDNLYILLPPQLMTSDYIQKHYPNSKKLKLDSYSSNKVKLLSEPKLKQILNTIFREQN